MPSDSFKRGERTKPATLIEEIRATCTQINDLGTAVSVLFQPRTFRAVVRVRNTYKPVKSAWARGCEEVRTNLANRR